MHVPGDIDILVRTVAGEARGESHQGKKAVVHVILNRAKSKKFKEHTIAQVCLKRKQFSCWNEEDRNFKYIVAIDMVSKIYRKCLSAVSVAMDEDDFTGGAMWYHAKSITPYWAKGKKPCFEEGNHVFYSSIN